MLAKGNERVTKYKRKRWQIRYDRQIGWSPSPLPATTQEDATSAVLAGSPLQAQYYIIIPTVTLAEAMKEGVDGWTR